MPKAILFYDGHCALCNFFVRLVIRFEPKQSIYFAALQSNFAKDLLANQNVSMQIDSIVFYEKENYYTYHVAIFKILAHLSYPWKALSIFKVLPEPVLKSLYKWVAKNRFKFKKRLDICPVPDEKIKSRFIF